MKGESLHFLLLISVVNYNLFTSAYAESIELTTDSNGEDKTSGMNSIYHDGGVSLTKNENSDKRDKLQGQSQTFDARSMERKFGKQSQHQQTDKDTMDKLGTKNQADSALEKVFSKAYKNRGSKGKGRYSRYDGHGEEQEYSFDDTAKLQKPKKEKKPKKSEKSNVSATTEGNDLMSEFGIEPGDGEGTFQVGGDEDSNTMEESKEPKGNEGFMDGFMSVLGKGETQTSDEPKEDNTDTTVDSLISSKYMDSTWSKSDKPGEKTYDFPDDEYEYVDEYYYVDEEITTTEAPRKSFLGSLG